MNADLNATLFIREIKGYPDFEYDILIGIGNLKIKRAGRFKLTYDPEKSFRWLFEDIEKTYDIQSLRDKGLFLYENFFPSKLKELYWKIRDRIRSIQVSSHEPWIPWEIIKPWRKSENGLIIEDPFLCQKYIFSRSLELDLENSDDIYIDFEEVVTRKFGVVKLVIPNDIDLEYVKEEREVIETLGHINNFHVSVDDNHIKLRSSLEKGGFDILHFSTHGHYKRGTSVFPAIDLEIDNNNNTRFQFRPENIISTTTTFGQSKPLVIMNACNSSIQGFYITGIGGWAERFLKYGACAFIGTLWSITDEAAYRFSEDLYKQLSAGTTLGEAIRKTREQYDDEHPDPSWFAFQLFGDPYSYIKLGS